MRRDETDKRILHLLRRNGRISNAELAKAVGLSASACLRRLRLLEDSGAIRGYTALIADENQGSVVVIVVQITLERQTEECLRKFETALRRCAEVRECFLMGGAVDYWVTVEAASLPDYERFHAETLSRLPHVARIQSNFAIRRVL